VDVSTYTWPIKVLFEVYNNGDGESTRMYVDDVSVEVCVDPSSPTRYYLTYEGIVFLDE
jgi:hypothetical protein